MKRIIFILLLVLVGCKPKRPADPTCHLQPDPETGFPVCRYY